MKTRKFKALRKVMAVFLALTVVLSAMNMFAVAAEPTPEEKTPIVYIDVSNKNIYITSTGWKFQSQTEKSFTGDYLLYGTGVKGIYVESGTHNITLHNLKLNADQWHSALSVSTDAVLNLKAVGINEIIAHNHAGITGYGTVNLSLGENSSVLLSRSYIMSGADFSVSKEITFSIEAGTSASELDMSATDWRKNELNVSKGTPVEHSIEMISTADGHYSGCDICGSNIENIAEHEYEYITVENGHSLRCTVCNYISDEVIEHTYALVGTSTGHRIACTKCGYYDSNNEVLATHTFVYTDNGSTHTAKCSVCDYVVENEYHDWVYSLRTEGEQAYEVHDMKCIDCSAEAYDYHYIWHEPSDDGHVEICYDCGYSDDIVYPHSNTYFYYIDGENCQESCGYCDADVGEPTAHNMSYYEYYDETYCELMCYNCGYYDTDNPILSEHVYSDKNEALDNESCVAVCVNCDNFSYSDAVSHVEGEPVTVAANGNKPGYTATYCIYCDFEMSKVYSPDTLIIRVSDENNSAWEKTGFVLYVNGVPTELIRYMCIDSSDEEVYGIHYDENKSYVFKYMSSEDSISQFAEISLLNTDGEEQVIFPKENLGDYYMMETVFEINTADYSKVDEAFWATPETFEEYTPQSVENFVNVIKSVERMLPSSEQSRVDAMADEINKAINEFEFNPNRENVAHGVINTTYYSAEIFNDETKKGYCLYDADGNATWYDYEGDYIVFDASDKENEYETYSNGYVNVVSGKVNIDMVNCYIVSEKYSPIGVLNESDVTLNLYGANAAVTTKIEAGITVAENAKLTIEDKGGSIIARGGVDCAGIGSKEYVEAGSVTINGGTIFALSRSDGAGIGSGFEAGFKKIVINDGKIWAECLSDDGAGIGVGDDGNGGDIIINGGDIIALSVDDDGAGIGGADNGSVDSITINGGKIVAGSEDAAAIGSGQDSDSSIGKITINGGEISASEWHDSAENLIGKGNSSSQDENENNFVHINGGTINTKGTNGISPKPRKKTEVSVSSEYNGVELEIALSNGEKTTAIAENGIITVYLHEGVTVESIMSIYSLKINFTSFGSETDTVIEIFAEDGTEEPLYKFNTVGNKSGLKFTGTWLIDEIDAGTYIVKVSKENHVTRTYTMKVGAGTATADMQINLLGDVTGDGQVRINDLSQINAHVKETNYLEDYALLCADITGDGDVKVNDLSRVNAHVKETAYLWSI